MKIGMIVSNLITLPPQPATIPKGFSGAPEMISWHLTETLVKRGHDLTLFAAGNSETSARLIGVSEQATSQMKLSPERQTDYEYWLISEALQHAQAQHFDVIHSQLPLRSGLFAQFFPCPVVTTLHSAFRTSNEILLKHAKQQYYISISNAQRKPIPSLNYLATIYHGLNLPDYRFNASPGEGLVFVGRIVPEKGPHIALEVAKQLDLPIDVFGEVPPEQQAFYDREVKPRLTKKTRLHGFASHDEVRKALSQAKAVLFPIDWEEPFGLVMIEAMACGTPVIAYRRGSVPEVIDENVSGYIVEPNNIKQFIETTRKVLSLPSAEYTELRHRCRTQVAHRFTLEKMAENHELAYQEAIDSFKRSRQSLD